MAALEPNSGRPGNTQMAELLLRDGPNILQEPKIPLIWEIYVN